MIDPPKTRAEAKTRRYNKWTGNPDGSSYDPDFCAYEFSYGGRWAPAQCANGPGKGPAALYCGIHANKIARDIRRTALREQWRSAGPDKEAAP